MKKKTRKSVKKLSPGICGHAFVIVNREGKQPVIEDIIFMTEEDAQNHWLVKTRGCRVVKVFIQEI